MSKFINPSSLVGQLGLKKGQVIADFGCGSGFYALPAAQMVGNEGMVCAVDVIESKLEATQSISRQMGFLNVRVIRANLEKPVLELTDGSCDAVILANILHEAEDVRGVIANVYRVLKSGGKVLVVEWKKEHSPIGPLAEKRIGEIEVEKIFQNLGFKKYRNLDTHVDGYHYALVFIK